MFRTIKIMLTVSLFFSSNAMSEEIDFKKCKYEFDATNAALGMRDHGKTKADLEATMPPREKTQGDPRAVLVHGILDDIFSRPDVASFPYFHYRALVCGTRAQGVNVTVPFEKIADDLVACQKIHGTDESGPLGTCVLEAVQKHL